MTEWMDNLMIDLVEIGGTSQDYDTINVHDWCRLLDLTDTTPAAVTNQYLSEMQWQWGPSLPTPLYGSSYAFV
jgi:hypothetical protein